MSCQDKRGSNCSLDHADGELMLLTDCTCPTKFPNVRRYVRAMPQHQLSLDVRLRIFPTVGVGGTVMPFLRSLWRCAGTCRSTVTINAEHLATLQRAIIRTMASRSRIMYSWNQNGAFVCDAMSSMEQMLIIDNVKGIPNFSAARAA